MQDYKQVKVTYNGNNRIVAEGDGIKIVLLIDKSELAMVYMGNEGTGKVIVTEK